MTRVEHKNNFGTAIESLKLGARIQRAGWHGKNMTVHMARIDDGRPYMVLTLPDGSEQPGWNASTPDVLAEDWGVLKAPITYSTDRLR